MGGIEHARPGAGLVGDSQSDVLASPEQIVAIAVDRLQRLDDEVRQRNAHRLAGLLRVEKQIVPRQLVALERNRVADAQPEYRITKMNVLMRDLSPRYVSHAASSFFISASVNGSVGLLVSLGALSTRAGLSLVHFIRRRNGRTSGDLACERLFIRTRVL
jgi:hypothetical protein